jgi:phospho-N-acetylmuramoyl-pentapeptide-transferase
MNYFWIGAAAALSFVLAVVFGLIIIPMLRKAKLGQHIREVGPNWHKTKEGTPTMGGIIFITAAMPVFGALLWLSRSEGVGAALLVLFLAVSCGLIGFLDDYEKTTKKRNLGLTVIQKLVLQVAVTIVFLFILRRMGIFSGEIVIPFTGVRITPPPIVTYVLSSLFIIFAVNDVNLTDGIDGLATGVTIPVAGFFLVAAVALGSGYAGLSIYAAALIGGLFGFLIFNFNPAEVIMGDTGSMFLGGSVAGFAFALDMPLILVVVGAIYFIEGISVILQVCYFKLTKGKRLFKMSPVHHHFELSGWSEKKIFAVFAGFTLLVCLVSAYWVIKFIA